jgi:hypothetical protein
LRVSTHGQQIRDIELLTFRIAVKIGMTTEWTLVMIKWVSKIRVDVREWGFPSPWMKGKTDYRNRNNVIGN